MKNIYKILLLILSGLVLISTTVFADPPQKPALPFYFVTGSVTSFETDMTVPNRQVILYRNETDIANSKYITATTATNGTYLFNSFELAMNFGGTVLAGDELRIAVPQIPGLAENGTSETVTLAADEGFTVKNLLIINKGGPSVGEIRIAVMTATGTEINPAVVTIGERQGVYNGTLHRYVIDSLPPGEYTVHAAANGYIPNSSAIPVTFGVTNATVTLEALGPGEAAIWGYTRDNATRIGLGGATIESVSINNSYLTASYGDGWYQQVVNADNYTLTAGIYGFFSQSASVPVSVGESKQQDFNLVLSVSNPGSIIGHVVNSGGYPIPGAKVSDRVREVTTLSDGSYSIPNVPPATYNMLVYANGYVPAFASGVVVNPNMPTTANFALDPLDTGKAAVLGLVRSSAGSDLVGADVNLVGPENRSTQSGGAGTYEVINIEIGGYNITASMVAYDSQTKSENFAVGEVKRVDFVLAPPSGMVPLTISKDASNNILVKWDTIYGIPKIFVLTGSGEGVYTNTRTSWTRLTDVNGLFGGTTYAIVVGQMTHTGQFSGGTSEAYYKAIQTNAADTLLPNAKAVGKFNVPLVANAYTIITSPLAPQKGDNKTWALDEMLGGQVNGEIQYNDGYLRRIASTSNSWPAMNLEISKGVWISSDSDKTCTLIGVVNNSYERKIDQGYDLYGFAYPNVINITQGAVTGVGIQPVNGDVIQLMSGGALVSYSYGASGWGSAFALKAGRGYWYQNALSSDRYFRVNY